MNNDSIFRDEIIKLMFLSSCFGTGKARVWELAQKFGSLDALYKAIAFEKPEGVFLPSELKSAEAITGKQLREIISYCHGHNIGIVGFNDTDYPPRLRGIFDPPLLLFYKGNIDLLSADVIISVVGARHISEYSENVTKRICSTLAKSGIVVASGFAVGTDITAHLSAVRSGGKTIAVLGAGIGYDYPAENMRYADEIAENGLFISEFFPNTSARPVNFPMRNRILSGISMGTAVIEAAEKSGSLNTASNAVAQGRDLWVVPPHDIFDSRYKGNIGLIHDGAIPLLSEYDIPCEYFENYSHKPLRENVSDKIRLEAESIPKAEKPMHKPEMTENKPKANRESVSSEPDESIYMPEGNAKTVYELIKNAKNGITPDEAAEISGLDISEVLMIITDLEIDGAVYSETGQEYFVN